MQSQVQAAQAQQRQESRHPTQIGGGASAPMMAMPVAEARFQRAIKDRRSRWPDFDSVVFAPDVPLTADMLGLMAESRYAADIAYYLGKHKEQAAAISIMSPNGAARAIYGIEAQFAAGDQK
jgi:hypothetical protein